MKKNILITGSVMNADSNSTKIYEDLVKLCENNGYIVKSPLDTMKFKGNDEERYIRAMQEIKNADFIIAEMSVASTGQGMELQQAIIEKKPILVIAKKGSKISSLIKGSKGIIDVLEYESIDDIKEKIIEKIN